MGGIRKQETGTDLLQSGWFVTQVRVWRELVTVVFMSVHSRVYSYHPPRRPPHPVSLSQRNIAALATIAAKPES